MKLIKLTKFKSDYSDWVEEIYINADTIISIRQHALFSEIDTTLAGHLRVKETIEEIQSQLEGKPTKKSINKTKVGQRIKAIRLAKGMNQTEFAKFTSVTVTGVQYWEYGKNLPSKERLEIIADLAGITVQKLLEG